MVSAAAFAESKVRLLDLPMTANYVGLRERLPLMMDSGAFQVHTIGSIALTPKEVLSIYRAVRPHLGVVLDYPLSPSRSNEDHLRRWKKTLANTKWMFRNDGVLNLVPVVHGYSRKSLFAACEDIADLGTPSVVGLGSLVPLVKSAQLREGLFRGTVNSREYVDEAVEVVRNAFPDSMLHVFGIGSVATLRRVLRGGADSVDTVSWRLKAAHGAIVLPGKSDRFVSPRRNGRGRVGLGRDDLAALGECLCPTCSGHPLSTRLRLLDNSRPLTFRSRAVHNAYVIRSEVLKLRSMIPT